MKTMRMVCGIISCCLFLVIIFQSCAVGIGNALEGAGEVSGTTGVFTAFLMLIAGIISIAGRKSIGATKTAMIFYAIAGLLACAFHGSYSDLVIWGIVNIIFAILDFISIRVEKKNNKTDSIDNAESKLSE